MGNRLHFDVVAIGGGFAGLCAAPSLVCAPRLSKPGQMMGICAARDWAGRIFHVSYHDVKLSPDELIAAINRQTGGEADCELAAATAEDCARTADWLATQGAEFVQANSVS